MRSKRGFSLVELMVVVAIIALLAGILMPALARARMQAKLVRVKADLYHIAQGLEMYLDLGLSNERDGWRDYPPARAFCMGGGMNVEDYYELSPELEQTKCLVPRLEDLFSPGRLYKYIAPGWGWANNNPSRLAVWVPPDFPSDDPGADPDSAWQQDKPYFNQRTSPVKCAVWSVGPSGPKRFYESDLLHYPVPRRTWYRPDKGLRSEGVIALIRTEDEFISSLP